MTFRHMLLAHLLLMVCLPIVMSLAAGQDAWAGYRGIEGMLVQAAEIGLEMRR